MKDVDEARIADGRGWVCGLRDGTRRHDAPKIA